MVTGFLAPISKSVRIVGCGRRVRVSGGHLCAKHRSTDRGGRRDLEPIRANFVCLPACGPQNCLCLGAAYNFDRCTEHQPSSSSAGREGRCSPRVMSPLGLLPSEGSWDKSLRTNAKKEKVFRREYLFFYLVAGEGLEPTTSGLWARRATNCSIPRYL